MKWMLIVLLALAAAALVVTVIGWSLPVAHTASRECILPVPPERVWQVIAEVERYPRWRSDVRRVEARPGPDGRLGWKEEGRGGTLTFVADRMEAPRQLVVRIADAGLPFGGSWTYSLVPVQTGTRLTIREDGEVYNPLFRFMSRFVFGHDATIAAYLTDLERELSARQEDGRGK
jgi:uncharacterized protein YndB with AHSA1/START domain